MSTLKLDTIQHPDAAGAALTFDSDGSITTMNLAAGLIDSDAIGSGAVSANKIASGAVEGAMTTQFGRRNLIINGAMQVAQRGTSETSVTSTGYKQAPDRYHLTLSSAGTWTASQSTTSPSGFSNSYKLACTTANASLSAGSYFLFRQKFEGQNLQHLKKGTSDALTTTLSFWVRSSKTGTYICELRDDDNGRTIAKSYTVSSADTWEYKSITFEGDTTGTLDNDNASSLVVQWWLVAGTNYTSGTLATSWETNTNANRAVGQVNLADSTSNDWYITGVQLEVGSVATPFEHRSFGEEEMLCRRYFQLITQSTTDGDTTPNRIYGAYYGSGGSFIQRPFVPSMRDVPDLIYGVSGGNGFSETYTSELYLGIYDNDDPSVRIYDASADAEL
jgi:hypothetical protein